jgi:hypothetical protein
MTDLKLLLQKQSELAAVAAQLANEKDVAKILQISTTIQQEAGHLQRMAGELETEQREKYKISQPETVLAEEHKKIESQNRLLGAHLLSQIASVSPQAAEAVAKLKADPNFMGGIFSR